MQSHKKEPFISVYEFWYVILAGMLVLLAANAKVLLDHFGLISSSAVVGDKVSNTIGSGLKVLDTFSATPGLVTFVTWGIIGLVLFSLVQAFVRASDTLTLQREISSNRFVHPANFNRQKYWHTILLNTFLSFGLITLLIIATITYVLFVAPVASLYLQRVLILPFPAGLLALGVSLFVIITGTLCLYTVLKAVLWQYRLSHI